MVGEALVRFATQANIYVSSWGPNDNGKAMQSPKKYMNEALNRTTHEVSSSCASSWLSFSRFNATFFKMRASVFTSSSLAPKPKHAGNRFDFH